MRTLSTALILLLAVGSVQAGDLIPTDRRFGPLRVALHKVDVSVDNQIALTHVEQVFANDHAARLEAHYIFPVPKNATIIDFSMTVNGKLVRGELLEKKRARQIYEGIVRRAKDPGLLEHVGSNIFRVRVFPILPHSTQKIELTYTERVNYDRGRCRHVYPLRVPGETGATRADRFEFRWKLDSAVPVTSLQPSFKADAMRRTGSGAEVTWKAADVQLSRDLEVAYRIKSPDVGMNLVAHRPKAEEEGTFLLLITPPDKAVRLPKDITFVLDTSGSMEGDRIRQARAALKFCLAKLGPDDRFNILAFSSEVQALSDAPLPATDENRVRACRFVDRLDATGGTNINQALLEALRRPADKSRPHLVLFLTDGEPTVGVVDPKRILDSVMKANQSSSRIFAFGVGEAADSTLVEDLADETGALSVRVGKGENIEVKVSRLQERIAAPVLSQLEVDWGKAEVSAVYPRKIGDLYSGTQLMVTGRYRKAGTFGVTLRGRRGKEKFKVRRKVTFPEKREESRAVPYLWAMRKVAGLLGEIRRSGETAEMVDQVIALSRKYRVATPYTSFLVLESEAAYDRYGIDRRGARATPPAPRTASTHTLDLKKSIEHPVYRKDATEADHNETADAEEFQKVRGDSMDFVSGRPFQGRATYNVIGGGGGGYGLGFGGRMAGRRNSAARGGGGADTEDAVLARLCWLAHHQSPDGSWEVQDHTKGCGGVSSRAGSCPPSPGRPEWQAGVTGLSMLAFLGSGYTHLSKDTHDSICFGDVVRKGLQWIMSHQDAEGFIGSRSGPKAMYGHVICTNAMVEAYGMTGSNLFRDQVQRAVDFLAAAQNPGRGWRYSSRSGDSDTSVTAWAVMAFRAAELSGITFPRSAYDGARLWLAEVTDAATGRAGYIGRNVELSDPGDSGESFAKHETPTAMAVMVRILVDRDKRDPMIRKGVALLMKDLPRGESKQADFTYWFFGSTAMFQFDGPDGARWKAWGDAMKDALLKRRNPRGTGCRAGSVDPEGRWGSEGGRVYATAMSALTLEVYYRYHPLFSSHRR